MPARSTADLATPGPRREGTIIPRSGPAISTIQDYYMGPSMRRTTVKKKPAKHDTVKNSIGN